MKLPNAEQAWIHPDKIVKYLLSETHERGRGKALFFQRFGFTVESWQELERALLRHARENEVVGREDNPRGVLYIVEGALHSPDDRNPQVRSVWMIHSGDQIGRLVTAYPLEV